MFDRRVGLGDGFSLLAPLFQAGGTLASTFIKSDADRSIARRQERLDFITATSNQRLVEAQAQLDLERSKSHDASVTKWVLVGAGTLALLGVVALVLRRR